MYTKLFCGERIEKPPGECLNSRRQSHSMLIEDSAKLDKWTHNKEKGMMTDWTLHMTIYQGEDMPYSFCRQCLTIEQHMEVTEE